MATAWYDYPITQGFKWKPSDTHAHSGIDIGDPYGTTVTAPMSGTIISQGFEPWGGQVNELVQTANGPEVLSYLHLSRLADETGGGHVQAGATIGSSGTPPPGYGKGAHLHFEETHGSTPPYMGYNPWNPTKSSYPLDPSGLLNSLRSGGGTGGNPAGQPQGGGGLTTACADCIQACGNSPITSGLCIAQCGLPGGPCFGISTSNPQGIPGPVDIGTAIQQFQVGAADALKRVAVFVMAGMLTLAGLYLMLKPQVDSALRTAARTTGQSVLAL